MEVKLARELGGARVRLLELLPHRREGRVMGVWSQSPHATVVWVRRGQLRTYFQGSGKPAPPLLRKEGSVVFLPPNLRRRSEYLYDGVSELLLAGISFETASGLELLSFLDVPRMFEEREAAGFRAALSRLYEIGLGRREDVEDVGDVIESRRIFLDILELLLAASKIRFDALALTQSNRMRPILESLAAKFTEDVDVGMLAKRACLSRPQFHRQFKALVGLPPLEYVKHLRLREAARLLRSCDMSMKEIGERVGWPNQFHFSRVFKTFYGVSPLKYRNDSAIRAEILA